MDLYFHISLVINRDKISTEGILPKATTKVKGFSLVDSKERLNKVYLVKDLAGINKIIETQAGEKYIYQLDDEGNPLYEVWVIDAEHHEKQLPVEPEKYWHSTTHTLSDFEYVTPGVCVSSILACIPLKRNLIELKSFLNKTKNL